MSTITLPNIRVSSDLTVGLKLKDGGVAIDWSTLSNIRVSIYADAQRSLAGRCTVAIDETDSTVLVCQYAANKPQYLGVNRVIVQCTYMGETKTYDKPAFTFVRWTDDQEGEEITISDPDVDVEIEVEDVSSSILNQAIAAALQAAEDAEHAAHLIPNQVLLDCEQATTDANAAAAAANAAGITSVQVSVEDNEPGTPSAECSLANKVLSVIFHYLKGETGDAAGFGTISASFVEDGGDPSVLVTASGPDTAKNIAFTLKNFKGDKGDKGDQGNTGSSVDYPYELVNNCTTNDATKGLSAAQGVVLAGQVSQLEAKVYDITGVVNGSGTVAESSSGWKYYLLSVPIVSGKKYKIHGEKVGNGAVNFSTGASSDYNDRVDANVLMIGYSDTSGDAEFTATGGATYLVIWNTVGATTITYSVEEVGSVQDINKAIQDVDDRVDEANDRIGALEESVDDKIDEITKPTITNDIPGEVEYYEQYGSGYGSYGIGQMTTEKAEDFYFDQVTIGPVKCAVAGTKKYSIRKGAAGNQTAPSTLTVVKEGTIPVGTSFSSFTIKLHTPIKVSAGERVCVYIWEDKNNTDRNTILGRKSEDAFEKYTGSKVGFYLSSVGSNPMQSTWANESSDFAACSPILALTSQVERIANEVFNEREEELKDENVVINLPDKIFAVVGDTLQIFYRGFIRAIDPYKYDIRVECTKGQRYGRYFEYTPVAADVGTETFKVELRNNNGGIISSKTCDLVTVASPVAPASSKKIACVGNSLTAGGEWCGEVARRLLGTGGTPSGKGLSNLVFCGPKESGLGRFFANGGWTWYNYIIKGGNAFRFQVTGVTSIGYHSVYSNNGHNYTVEEVNVTNGVGNILCSVSSASDTPEVSGTLTKVSGSGDATITFTSAGADSANPFWDIANNKLSFIPFANEFCGGTIDVMYVLLGWNGQTPYKQQSDFGTSSIETFVNTLHSEFPSAKVKIMGIQMPNQKDMHTYGANAGYSDMYGMTYTAMMQNKVYQDFANLPAYSGFVEYVDVATQFDSENNMPTTTKAVNLRNTETELIGSNGVHPANSGYMQIADVAYRNIVAELCQ